MATSSHRYFLLTLWLIALVMSGLSGAAHARESDLSVMADEKLLPALLSLTRDYVRAEGFTISLLAADAEAEDDVATRIRGGLPVDMILTANTAFAEKMKQAGLVDQNASKALAEDPLVLLASVKHSAKNALWASPATLALSGSVRMVWQENSGLSQEVLAPLLAREMPHVQVRFASARSPSDLRRMLAEPDTLAIAANSYAVQMEDIKILRHLTGQGIRDVNMLVIAGDQMSKARRFADFLASPEAKLTLRAYGFLD